MNDTVDGRISVDLIVLGRRYRLHVDLVVYTCCLFFSSNAPPSSLSAYYTQVITVSVENKTQFVEKKVVERCVRRMTVAEN